MMKVCQLIMFFVTVASLYHLSVAIIVCHKRIQTVRKLRKDPPELSSDEEDDREFFRNREADRAAREREREREREQEENRANNNEINRNEQERRRARIHALHNHEPFDVGSILMNQIRQIIDTSSRRRHILGQMHDIERRLLEATQ